MTLIGMPDAAARVGIARNTMKRALENAGVPLVKINGRAFAVDENDLSQFIARRGGVVRPGRPAGAKNKPKASEDDPNAGEMNAG